MVNWLHAFFYKQHFYKQNQAEIGKKLILQAATPQNGQTRSNNCRLAEKLF